uniref:Uncharacterized protein n=1 Tax=Leersia perrieri TaxID=77586 RepID=A0A0D9W992_9ORYZ
MDPPPTIRLQRRHLLADPPAPPLHPRRSTPPIRPPASPSRALRPSPIPPEAPIQIPHLLFPLRPTPVACATIDFRSAAAAPLHPIPHLIRVRELLHHLRSPPSSSPAGQSTSYKSCCSCPRTRSSASY